MVSADYSCLIRNMMASEGQALRVGVGRWRDERNGVRPVA